MGKETTFFFSQKDNEYNLNTYIKFYIFIMINFLIEQK